MLSSERKLRKGETNGDVIGINSNQEIRRQNNISSPTHANGYLGLSVIFEDTQVRTMDFSDILKFKP